MSHSMCYLVFLSFFLNTHATTGGARLPQAAGARALPLRLPRPEQGLLRPHGPQGLLLAVRAERDGVMVVVVMVVVVVVMAGGG